MAAVMTAPTRPKRWKWNSFTRESTQQTIRCLLWTLHELGGSIEDSSGRCGRELVAASRERGYIPNHIHDPFVGRPVSGSLSQLLHELDSGNYAGTIARQCNGKRTFKITLLLDEDQLPPKPMAVTTKKVEPTAPKPKIGDTRPAPEPARVITKEAADAVLKPAPTPPPPVAPTAADDSDTGQVELPAGLDIAPPISEPDVVLPVVPPLVVADAGVIDLLLEVQQLVMKATVAAATEMGGPNEPRQTDDYDDLTRRLAETLEENNRLRRKCNEQRETLMAKVKENEALRKAMAIAQNNIRVMQEASQPAELERKLNALNGTQRAIASRPEPAIAARR